MSSVMLILIGTFLVFLAITDQLAGFLERIAGIKKK